MALGGSSRALSSAPSEGLAAKGSGTGTSTLLLLILLLLCSLQPGPCYASGLWEPAHTPHRAELWAWGHSNTFFHLSPLPRLCPRERDEAWPRGRGRGTQQVTPGAVPPSGAAPAPPRPGAAPLSVCFGLGGLKLGPTAHWDSRASTQSVLLLSTSRLCSRAQPGCTSSPSGAPLYPLSPRSGQLLSGRTRPWAASIQNRATTDRVFGSLPQ